MRVLVWLTRACAVIFALGIVSLVLARANELLGLGIWDNHAPQRSAVTFYVDAAHGDDAGSGTSPATAWRTLDRVGEANFVGGDRLLLRGGQRHSGRIAFEPSTLESTSPTEMLTIGSYGHGRATVDAGRRDDAIVASDVAGIHVSRLNLVGHGNRVGNENASRACRGQGFRASDTDAGVAGPTGIRFTASGIDGTLDQGIKIDHVDVSRFCDGIVFASADNASRIAHVRVRAVRAHDNGDAGVWTYDRAEAQHSIEDVRVTDTRAYRNHRRGGIVLFGVDRAEVSDSTAFANARGAGGGVGIWAFDANRVRFTDNEAFGNGKATLDNDGDGFDFDRGVSNSSMSGNYSHDNGGIGFLVCSCGFGGDFYRMDNNVLRSNVSRNDGSSGQPSLYILGGEPMNDIEIRSNRVESATGTGPLILVSANHRPYSDVHLRDNTFVAKGGKRLMTVESPGLATDLGFDRNIWRAVGGPFRIEWGQRRFVSLQAWRAAVHQRADEVSRAGSDRELRMLTARSGLTRQPGSSGPRNG